ncbi:MAG: hypothetical protein M1814_005146 [Vezdaea aestivalis]|nr:MAG: hypothetical protein M1814_005146 [Vezdaea aestivalis]
MTTRTITDPSNDSSSSPLFTNHSLHLPSSRPSSSPTSKAYKQASTLFLTRRLQEAHSILVSLITTSTSDDNPPSPAPVTTAPTRLRIKIWSLYITLLDEIIKLGALEGKSLFGSSLWRSIQTQARDGSIWDQVVAQGYAGDEAAVDAVVIAGLVSLLLAHAPEPRGCQERLERWLAASGGREEGNVRVRVLELYALHVLPRNGEWEFAEEVVLGSAELDEEQREGLLGTLRELREEERGAEGVEEGKEEKEDEEKVKETRAAEETERTPSRARSTSEVDYGIETPLKPAHNVPKATAPLKPAIKPSPTPNTKLSSPRSTSRKLPAPAGSVHRAAGAVGSMRRYIQLLAQSLSTSPMALLRTLLFVLGLVLTMSRRDVRERIQRMTALSWNKLRGTVGMGVKVSYM